MAWLPMRWRGREQLPQGMHRPVLSVPGGLPCQELHGQSLQVGEGIDLGRVRRHLMDFWLRVPAAETLIPDRLRR